MENRQPVTIQPKKKRVFNFSPGPAKIPESVIEKAQRELHDYEHTGHSVLEMSHRSKEFDNIIKPTEKLFRDLMDIPSDYEVLFLQGGGTGQFASVPLNLTRCSGGGERPTADYLVTGTWSSKAAIEAAKFVNVNKVLPQTKRFTGIADTTKWKRSDDPAYTYYCANETIHGIEFHFTPETKGNEPLVADISSNVLSRPFDIRKHGVAFAGTQKNIGAAGLTVAIARHDLIERGADPFCPSIFDYKQQRATGSVFNTPPVYSIYLTKLVLEWIRDSGGVPELDRQNSIKSKLIYDIIDSSNGFYSCPVAVADRSRMNISFRIGSTEGVDKLEKSFLEGAEQRNMLSLKGHRSVGGIRASLYNAVTVDETEQLAEFMREFVEKNSTES